MRHRSSPSVYQRLLLALLLLALAGTVASLAQEGVGKTGATRGRDAGQVPLPVAR